mmetsp:Transcript_40679/g.73295  ORF Transcript_40679/g.73295 Transcript_40679/m.73295 type:complete len:1003 (-) Transcript_40679:64-3072(-)|eukprot:CAMPEP_0197624742 /NCGR_PEP_ID=MMETSP1338-20131121/4280_1 /TAXON_ID=43686 ORGANISM="Pelagodinium beii, Strain RCC1491" /NCGR_SAMPLE_ID=MMETSP1338 /ASSEMBLY_ACC=CAM_ASM_000754 /LENGTH=1002 /DNA_ID=CAMNT_0043194941 /DNA_START=42 /DNA_END=3050 /DNA_ORIENTATION=-
MAVLPVDAKQKGHLDLTESQAVRLGDHVSRPHTASGDAEDIVQFASAIFFCAEDEGSVTIQVVRLGEDDNSCTVGYSTRDVSALAGKKYHHVEGFLTFGHGEFIKELQVQLIENECFEATLEFAMDLHSPHGCVISPNLDTCRVLVADDDAFPTNKFKDALRAGDQMVVPGRHLMLEYYRMALSDRKLRKAAISNLLTDQTRNLVYLWHMMLSRYMIDSVLKPVDQRQESMVDQVMPNVAAQVWALTILSVIPHGLIVVMLNMKAMRKLQGMAVNQLQGNLVRRFLNYNEASRDMVSTSDLCMAITRDVPELVERGFMKLFDLLESLGLVFILGFTAFLQQDISFLWLSLLLFLSTPLALVLFIFRRHAETERRDRDVFNTQTETLGLLHQIIDNFRLITDYWQQPEIAVNFNVKVGLCNTAINRAGVWRMLNNEFAPCVTTLVVGIYTLACYGRVIDGTLELGVFLTGVAIWRGIGASYQRTYQDMLTIQAAMAPLRNIVHYMNMPVDTMDRLKRSRRQLEKSLDAQIKAHAQLFKGIPANCDVVGPENVVMRGKFLEKATYPQDLLRIRGTDITFAYNARTGGGDHVLHNASFMLPQGSLVAVSGSRGCGKRTLLEMIAGLLVPSGVTPGMLFIPPHLRVLHVAKEPMQFSDLDVFSNLIFGPSDGADEEPERVLKICKRLGLSHEAMHMVENAAEEVTGQTMTMTGNRKSALQRMMTNTTMDKVDPHAQGGSVASVAARKTLEKSVMSQHSLPYTEKCLLHLCRAFVMNPEVLILHKPLEHFNHLHARRVVDLLREFVDNRGLEKPEEELGLRRPRTAIFSVGNADDIDLADVLLQMNEGKVNLVDVIALKDVRQQIQELFHTLDSDQDGLVSGEEFVGMHVQCPGYLGLFGIDVNHPKKSCTDMLIDVFKIMDDGDSGKVDVEEMMEYLKSCFNQNVTKLSEAFRNPAKSLQIRSAVRHPNLKEPSKDANGHTMDKWDAPEIPEDAAMPPLPVAAQRI